MGRIAKRTGLPATVAIVLGSLATAAGAERINGSIVDVGGALAGGPNSGPVVIQIDSYSTDQEVEALAKVLSEKGPDALREALWDLEKGWIRVGGSLGYPIAVARSLPDGAGRRIRLMIDRPITFFEAVRNLRSTDYPFSFVEIRLDESGKGEGQVIAAAKVALTGGTLEIESYGLQPFRILNARVR